MLDLTFTIEGVPEFHRRLMIATEGVKTYRKPFTQIGGNLQKTFQLNFSQRGALFGGWAPRKPQYRHGSRVDTWPLLEKTGRMRKSFGDTVTDTSITLFNTSPYFKYHQSRAARTHLPRRVMMQLNQDSKTMIVKELQAYILSVTGGRR